MIIICEECGKKYRIDPAKIKGRAASFKCRVCTHVIMVKKPEPQPPEPQYAAAPPDEPMAEAVGQEAAAEGSEFRDQQPVAPRVVTPPSRRGGGMGLRAKMFLLFLVIPLVLMIGASLAYLWQLQKMAALLNHESAKIVNRMAEEKIAALSKAVAIECRLYLMSHPALKRQDFMHDMGFRTLAVQKVGMTGYTALYEMPDKEGVWHTWAHVNPRIIGIDMSKLKKPLGKNFAGFWRIFTGVRGGKKSQGYYTWQDKDGTFRDKFMVCTPVVSTPYVVAATTYMDEFSGPVKLMQQQAEELTAKTRLIIWVILGATILLIGIIVFSYGQRLTGKLKSLTEVAERISIGELGIEVETKSRDEIGELAEAISRMQDSIRLSIERLRRRR